MPYYPRYLPPTSERFEDKVCRVPIAGCWLWMGAIDPNGYGRFRGPDGKTLLAHRFAFEQEVGPIPGGLDLCHRCDLPTCCNPAHMFIGTQKANMEDAVRKGRTSRGSHRPLAVLSDDQVRAIKADGDLYKAIAARYGVNPVTIGDIKRGKSWSHVK